LILLFSASPAQAQWISDGTPVCTYWAQQTDPQITGDGGGGAIITWMDYRNGGGYDIFALRVGPFGLISGTVDGASICTAPGGTWDPRIIEDGSGGAIIAWKDYRSGSHYDIYAQRINGSASFQWTRNGNSICTAAGSQIDPQLASDGSGGAIITWADLRSGNYDIYAQRVDPAGNPQWAFDGVAICTEMSMQFMPQITSDGSGGAIIAWWDIRGGSDGDIYAQRIGSGAAVQWPADGVPVCTATENQNGVKIVADGSGGAVLVWYDYRSGDGDIYAQRLNAVGQGLWAANGIPVCNVLGSQFSQQLIPDGGSGAIVTWEDQRTGNTNIYAQRISGTGVAMWTANGVEVCIAPYTQSIPQLTGDGSGGAIIAWQDRRGTAGWDIYAQRINTTGSALWAADGIPICIAPGDQQRPQIIQAGSGGAMVTWDDMRGSDLDIYALKIDGNGNSPPTGTLHTPRASYLEQNYPNPFNPVTNISFGINKPGHMTLRIYDVSGKLIRLLIDERRDAGRYTETWDGLDDKHMPVSSGIFLYRLSTDGFKETRKMVLLR
jgi:hypothetical protein